MREPQPPFVSVKFDAVGRPHRFLLPEIDFESPLRAGEQVVVTRGDEGRWCMNPHACGLQRPALS